MSLEYLWEGKLDELFIVKRYLVKVTKDKYLKRLLQLKKRVLI